MLKSLGCASKNLPLLTRTLCEGFCGYAQESIGSKILTSRVNKIHIRNPDVESYQLVYKCFDSEGVRGGGGVQGGSENWGGAPEFYWTTFTKY